MKYSTMFLYGIVASDLADMRYEDALHAKIKGAREVMKQCSKVAHDAMREKNRVKYDAMLEQYIAAEKAVDYNQNLLGEML